MKLKKTIAYQLLTYVIDNLSPIAIIVCMITAISFFLIPLNPDRDFNANSSVIIAIMMLFVACSIIMYRYFYVEGKKQAQINNRVNSTLYPKGLEDKFDNVAFIYYMDGKRFTIEEGNEYFEAQKLRGRKAFRLMVYDCTTQDYIFIGYASEYFEKPSMIENDKATN